MEIIYVIILGIFCIGAIVALLEYRRGKPFNMKPDDGPTGDPFLTGEVERVSGQVNRRVGGEANNSLPD